MSDLWGVDLEVDGLMWWPKWSGYAYSSQHATASALADFEGKHGALKVTVKAVYQVGV